jgi:hypothetical protein
MWWKLAGLAVIALALVVVFFAPIASVDIDVPQGMSPPTTSQIDTISNMTNLVVTVIWLGCLGAVAWLAIRTIRYHLNLKK